MANQITLHIVNEEPWSNLNRDDTGLPKRMLQGGVQRGLLSSQSIKRGARVDYEKATGDRTVRSANIAEIVAARAAELNPGADIKALTKEAKKRIGGLTAAKEGDGTEAGRSIWLSKEEIEAAAHAITADQDTEFILAGKTGALAIASFGRMFAMQPLLQTEAAIAVSPAVSTHETVIEADYFSTVEERPKEEGNKGAAYLGIAHFLNGVFYRTVTIDRKQLEESWTGFDQPDAREKLKEMVTALIYGMPRGKENSTAPYVLPALVLVEAQEYRVAYNFEAPVQSRLGEGFLNPTIESLRAQWEAARQFDPENFPAPEAIAGTAPNLDQFGIEVTNRDGISSLVADWILS